MLQILLAILACSTTIPSDGRGATHTCCGARIPGMTGHEPGAIHTQDAGDEDRSGDNESDKSGEEKKPEWDVEHPPLPFHDVPIDTDEGTWMNLDLSPDGSRIVFDLLGDIYVIPAAGGDATPLTQTVAWEMQPRYSPDGTRIAYTSDAGGGDNIWIMSRDGSDPKPVTKEKFRLPSGPAWTPDGEYIVARKHFTSHRSIGSGEMWLYHHTGGDGLQMTEKPNEQKDVGEPVFSPDGKYLYYSHDVSPGGTFEYNKDPNRQIYAVSRLDRKTGETDRFITGPGGAVRPTPSPDGKYIAFVRRVRHQSTLFLHEIGSGREWPIYDDLERDMQETWAIHGVYPTMAWTPDAKSIIFWARGKIRRIDVGSKQVEVIPFHVTTTKKVAEALRYPVEVAPDRFDVKIIRWPTVAPDGSKVVYQALGHLYVRDLPEGTPRRLTAQADHFEFYPSFSPDGEFIVYTSWNDESLGAVRIVSASGGGEGRVITEKPGHYIEPVFSSDSKNVVYRRIGGGGIFTDAYSRDPGVYVVPTTGGEPKRITKKGAAPQFGPDPTRVYLTHTTRDGGKDKATLFSIDLDGSDERDEAVGENTVEFRVSPDGKWLAFVERFNVYVIPFPPTGKAINVGPKTSTIPIKRVSRDAGLFLQWSGDSNRLHWSHGPELFTRELTDVFAFLEGAPEELPEPPTTGRDIAFQADYDKPAGAIALTGARIITMRGDEVIENGTIIIERNRITGVGRSNAAGGANAVGDSDAAEGSEAVGGSNAAGGSNAIAIPEGARVFDVTGHTIIPGLVDVHDHGGHGRAGIIPQQNWSLYAKAAFGVTTVHDPSHDSYTIFASAELAKAGLIVAPRIFSTGTILYGAAGNFKAEVDSLDDARSHIRRMKALGAISVKSYNQPRRDQRQQLIAAARELEMMVVPEGGSLHQHNLTMIVDGHTGIEHAMPIEVAYRDVIDLWSHSGTSFTPTMTVGYGGLWGEEYWYQKTNVWENERLLGFVPRDVVDPRSRRRGMVPDSEFNHFTIARMCKSLIDAGGKANLGAHGQLPGLAHHWELWMFAQGGMTPLEVIRAGTLHPAWYVGLDNDIGSIEEGKLADLVVLEGNPLEDIRQTAEPRYTILNGRVYDARTMNQLAPAQKNRRPFPWEWQSVPRP